MTTKIRDCGTQIIFNIPEIQIFAISHIFGDSHTFPDTSRIANVYSPTYTCYDVDSRAQSWRQGSRYSRKPI